MTVPAIATPVHRVLYWLARQLCFSRVTVFGLPHTPGDGPVLYVGLHRNGALDAIPYLKAVPGAAYLVSAQLHRSAIGRFLFPGIPVARSKDRDRGIVADNDEGIMRCVRHLVSGGELFVMPEGTSSLGPRHLPFKPGAAWIAHEVLARGTSLTMVPFAVHYECAWEWQSRVEVVAGPAFVLKPEDQHSVRELQKRLTLALEEVGINVVSTEELRLIEMLAYGATLGTGLSYAKCLKHFEQGVPDEIRRYADTLTALAGGTTLLKHQGVPLVPNGSALPYVVAWLVTAPIVLIFLIANLPPILAGHIASRKLPDDLNVVAFWRAMIGVPAALIWTAAMILMLWTLSGLWAVLAYVGLSILGLKLLYRFRKLSVALFNRFRAPQIKPLLLAFRDSLLRNLGHDRR